MKLTDYHIHSNFSMDGKHSIEELARAAVLKGLSEIAVTDHVDILDKDSLEYPYDWESYYARLTEARDKFTGRLKILCAMELGQAVHEKEFAERLIKRLPYDFIIGSHHRNRNEQDFYFLKVNSADEALEHISRYIDELIEYARWGLFSVAGHITYPLRYIRGRDGINVSFDSFYDRLELLFKTLAEKGLGIEINTSGLRNSLGETMPDIDLIRLYKACGGEIVTVGSDAHTTDDVGAGISEAHELLLQAGFKYVASFEGGKPGFIKI